MNNNFEIVSKPCNFCSLFTDNSNPVRHYPNGLEYPVGYYKELCDFCKDCLDEQFTEVEV